MFHRDARGRESVAQRTRVGSMQMGFLLEFMSFPDSRRLRTATYSTSVDIRSSLLFGTPARGDSSTLAAALLRSSSLH